MPMRWGAPPLNEKDAQGRKECDNAMMDFENWALQRYAKKTPVGLERYKVDDWKIHIKAALEDSDTSWDEYVSWVKLGGGDEWFQEASPIKVCPSTEPSTRCSGCNRNDDFCRCGSDGVWWG